jgi:hypothetical protein
MWEVLDVSLKIPQASHEVCEYQDSDQEKEKSFHTRTNFKSVLK